MQSAKYTDIMRRNLTALEYDCINEHTGPLSKTYAEIKFEYIAAAVIADSEIRSLPCNARIVHGDAVTSTVGCIVKETICNIDGR